MDFLGSKAIALKVGESSSLLMDGDTLIADVEMSMLDDVSESILPIKEKAENLMTTLDSTMLKLQGVITDVEDVLSERNKRKFTDILTNLNSTIVTYNEVAQTMQSTVRSMKPTIKNLETFSDSLAALEMNQTLVKAQETFENMSNIMAKINEGQGTMGQLINNDSLYMNLEAVTKDMDLLLIDMKEHPKRYVHFSLFGRKEKD